MEPSMTLRLVVGLAIVLVCLAFAAKRALFLINLGRSGQPAPGR